MSVDPETLFELSLELGYGTYGKVYLGKSKKTGEQVAVKILPFSEDKHALKKEVEIMKQCKNDFIVRCEGSYEKDASLWIIMELCEPGSIADCMRMKRQTLDEVQIQLVCASVLHSLSYLHSRKYIHRDIKAANILLTRTGQVKIADFGVSAQFSTLNSKHNTAIGAPFWMAPEVIMEEQYNSKADLWSLGISIIEMAEGKPPLHEIHPMRAIFMIPKKDPPVLREPGKWSADMVNFVSRCLVKDQAGRQSADELLLHPFVRKVAGEIRSTGGRSAVLKQLVDECLPLMEEYRNNMTQGTQGDDTLQTGALQSTLVTSFSDKSMDATS